MAAHLMCGAEMPSHDYQLISTEDGSYTIYDPTLDESYHSTFGARTESDQVFVENSGVLERLKLKLPTRVLEIGFGTGFNFAHTTQLAIDYDCPIEYTSVEMYPLPSKLVSELLQKNALEKTLCEFTANALHNVQANHSDSISIFKSTVSLELINADATQTQYHANHYHAIYLDAFSRKNNPDLWGSTFLGKLHNAIHPRGTLATYSVNSPFRQALNQSGWQWQKLPGPKGKREVLIARQQPSPDS